MAEKTYEEAIAAYLSIALQDADYGGFIESIGHIARAHGISSVAQSTGLGRESLYKALARGSKPRFETVCRVIASLGLRLVVMPAVPRDER